MKLALQMRRLRLSACPIQSAFCALFVAICVVSPLATAAVDMVVAIDNSGSMRQNDPAGLVPIAVRELASRFSGESRLGILLFDTKSSLVMPLTVSRDPAYSTRVRDALKALDYRGRLTDTPGAVEQALYELRERGRKDSPHVILVITDGFVDVGTDQRSRDRTRWLTGDLVGEAQREHVAIFGVAFTSNADFELIQSISQTTGGLYFRAPTAEDLAGVFQRIEQKLIETSRQVLPQPPAGITKSPLPAGGVPLFWLVVAPSVALMFIVVIWRLQTYRTSPPIAATLQDVGQHSLQAAYPLKRVTRVGSVRGPRWAARNDIVLPYPTISRRHAEIRFSADGFVLCALPNTTNYSYVNGRRLVKGSQVAVTNGDVLRFDAYEFRFLGGRVPVGGLSGRRSSRKTQLADGGGVGDVDDFALPKNPPVSPAGSTGEKPAGTGQTLKKPAVDRGCCPVCGEPVPPERLEMWGTHRICPECRVHILSTASPEEVQHILARLDAETPQKTLIKPGEPSGV